ncbi:MAG TPA: FG-GAP-like repeat-containing protein [Candidatus Brocadiia bacterium]|nr:FG-GAP-like repeat-containing protein [Candidatus Brocadiia bacterium]
MKTKRTARSLGQSRRYSFKSVERLEDRLLLTAIVDIDLQPGSDTGASDTDNITADNTPTFDVTVNGPGDIELDYDGDGVADVFLGVDAAGTYPVKLKPGIDFSTFQHVEAGGLIALVASADFNNDGQNDLATTHSWDSDAVSIVIANGDGTFQPSADFPAGLIQPNAITSSDFNGDGNADVAVAEEYQSAIAVLLGNGDGTLGSPLILTAGTYHPSIVAYDLDANGTQDMVVPNYNNDNISVFLGNGDGTFQPQATYAVGDRPGTVCVADMNSDGAPDLIVSQYAYTGSVSILPGNGDGSFGSRTTIPIGMALWGAEAADLNADGNFDLFTANGESNHSVSVRLSNGDGTFQPDVTYAAGRGVNRAHAIDMNGDSILDIVSCGSFRGDISVFQGNGDGTFQPQTLYATGIGTDDVVSGDFNGDGIPDLVASTSHWLTVLYGEADGSLRGLPTYLAVNSFDTEYPLFLDRADFDNDGNADIVSLNYVMDTFAVMVSVFLGNADGTFQEKKGYAVGRGAFGLACRDFNGDGNADILVTNVDESNNGSVRILDGNGDGTFDPLRSIATPTVMPVSLLAGDFNGDDVYDLALSSGTDSEVAILVGIGDGTFQPAVDYVLGQMPMFLTAGDINNDGSSDLLVTPTPGNDLSVLLGNGDGTFVAGSNITPGDDPGFVALTDLDSDGNSDLAVMCGGDDSLHILIGNGDGTFQPPVAYPIGDNWPGLRTADFDLDGRQDVAVVNEGLVHVFVGNGDGSLKDAVEFGGGNCLYDLNVHDFNHDGLPDMVVADHDAGRIGVLLAEAIPLSGFGDGDIPLAGPEVTVTFTNDVGEVGTDSQNLVIDTAPPEVTEWQTALNHGGGVGELVTTIANGYVESRYQGIKKLVINMDEAMNPGSVDVSDLSIVGVSHGDQSSLITSAVVDGSKITIGLSAALPDIDTYTVILGGAVEDLAGNAASGISQIAVKALRGDANGDGQVNSFDLLNIRAFVGQAVTAANARRDINGDGVINSFDQLMARVYVGNKIT